MDGQIWLTLEFSFTVCDKYNKLALDGDNIVKYKTDLIIYTQPETYCYFSSLKKLIDLTNNNQDGIMYMLQPYSQTHPIRPIFWAYSPGSCVKVG